MLLHGWLLVSSLLLVPPPERADRPPEFSVALDSVFSLTHGDFGTSSTFRFGVRPRPHLEFSATVGVAHQQFSQRSGPKLAETRASNLMLGTRWIQDEPGRKHHAYVGFSLVIPTDVDGEATQFQTLLGEDVMRMRGGWDAWLWLPNTNAAVVPFGWRRNGERGVVGIDGALAGLVHMRGGAGAGAQLRLYGGIAVRRSILGIYSSAAVDGLNGRYAFGSGVFVETPLCKASRETCPVRFTGTAGVGFSQTEDSGVSGPTISTGLGLRWGSS